MNKKLEELKKFCITNGVEERFFYSFYSRLLISPYNQCVISSKNNFNPAGRDQWQQLYNMLNCFVEKMPEHKNFDEWKKSISFLKENKPKGSSRDKK